ncbi:MAG: rhomboid family intramembrane serine protease [Elusimicrobia bacterium]|nr:rhomboid family intramembrane serine protease [Elusimicrobiota bacterium]
MKLILSYFFDLPPVTRRLIILMFAGYALKLALGNTINYVLGLVPYEFAHDYRLWQAVTYMFVHGGFWHFLINVFMLWMFGRFIEPVLGKKTFLLYFLLTGIGAGLITTVFSLNSARPVVGASGAIYGLLIAFAMLYPDQKVYLYFLFPVTSRQMVLIAAALELAASFSGSNSGVANTAHLGGMAVGYAYFKLPREIRRYWRRCPDAASVQFHRGKLEAEVDRILEKISREGESSISGRERAFLEKYSRKQIKKQER